MQKFVDKLVLYGLCAAFAVDATGDGVAYLLISLILMCLIPIQILNAFIRRADFSSSLSLKTQA